MLDINQLISYARSIYPNDASFEIVSINYEKTPAASNHYARTFDARTADDRNHYYLGLLTLSHIGDGSISFMDNEVFDNRTTLGLTSFCQIDACSSTDVRFQFFGLKITNV